MSEAISDLTPTVKQDSRAAAKHVVVGALLGLAWGCSLRAWMALLALQLGDNPKITWQGTVAGVLLPAMLVGTLDGGAVYAAKASDRKRWRWAILSPALLVLGPLLTQENFISTLLRTGLGGGAIGVALIGMLGGYAFSGFGPKWTRLIAAILALLFLIASIVPLYVFGSSPDRPSAASMTFSILLFVLLMAGLVAGNSAPSRSAASPPKETTDQ